MPAVRPLDEAASDRERGRWDAYVASRPDATCYHLLAWREVIRASFGHATPYLAAWEGDQITGVLPLCHLKSRLFGSYLVSLPFFNYGGILASDPKSEAALLEAAVDLARERGCGHLELRMTRPLGGDLKESRHKVAMWADLPETAEALWASFKPKLRSQIRRAEREAMTARIGGVELLDAFYAVFSRNMRDLGTPVYAKAFFANVLALHTPSRIVAVFLGERPVAAGFLVGFRDRLEIPWASSLREYNALAPNMLLYWKVLEHACAEGYRTFDFGRSSPDSGTYRFKAQWGARPVPCHWHYWLREGDALPELSPANPKYRLAIQVWRRLPLALTELLGPRIVRNLP